MFSCFHLRQSRFDDFYDREDGDWGWLSTNIDEDREQFFTLTVPETPDEFYFYYFSIRSNKSFSNIFVQDLITTVDLGKKFICSPIYKLLNGLMIISAKY